MLSFLIRTSLHTIATAGVFYWLASLDFFTEKLTITGDDIYTSYALVAFVFGLINTFIRPVVKVLALPFQLLTLGVAGVVVNATMLWLLTQIIEVLALGGTTITVTGTANYVLLGAILALANAVIHQVVR